MFLTVNETVKAVVQSDGGPPGVEEATSVSVLRRVVDPDLIVSPA